MDSAYVEIFPNHLKILDGFLAQNSEPLKTIIEKTLFIKSPPTSQIIFLENI